MKIVLKQLLFSHSSGILLLQDTKNHNSNSIQQTVCLEVNRFCDTGDSIFGTWQLAALNWMWCHFWIVIPPASASDKQICKQDECWGELWHWVNDYSHRVSSRLILSHLSLPPDCHHLVLIVLSLGGIESQSPVVWCDISHHQHSSCLHFWQLK